MRRFLVVLNPKAGLKKGVRQLKKIQKILEKAGDVTLHETTARGDATAFVREHAAEFDTVVSIGGDGTLNEVIAGLRQSGANTKLAHIPAGSTNDFAASLYLPIIPKKAAKNAVKGVVKPLDVGSFNGRDFVYIASCGAFSKASYSAPQDVKNVIGHLAYLIEGIKELSDIHPVHLRVETDGATYEDDYIFAAFCNSTSCGGVLKLARSRVDMNDGLHEMLLVRMPKTMTELGKFAELAKIADLGRAAFSLAIQQYTDPLVTLCSAAEFRITAPADNAWTLDGEYQEGAENILIKNEHDAIQILLPKKEKKPKEPLFKRLFGKKK
ncbi:MAG: YegS/Rv2252/BmrU family lipid kinase [Clostridia bacterium]|nr:YegS/Rv2252/BmrU family lipid kinase [Clostridia bacterium]